LVNRDRLITEDGHILSKSGHIFICI